MKLLLLLLVITTPLYAKPLVVLSYYDPFQGAGFNNSQRVAAMIAHDFNSPSSELEIYLCPLNTIFDRAYGQLERCVKNSPRRPALVLGLGETGCKLKVETIMQNKDLSRGTDNAGERRTGSEIIPGGPKHISLRYPLPKMYCALKSKERKTLVVSKSAGTFVCNNTAFLMSYYYPETMFGFIHVPAHNCANLPRTNPLHARYLSTMIKAAVAFDTSPYQGPLPHSSNEQRLPLKKEQLNSLRLKYRKEDKCLHEFFTRAKGIDEAKR